jgi:Carboxypeptidase regulatory-like domain
MKNYNTKQFSFAILLVLAIAFGCKRNEVIDDNPTTPGVVVPVNDATQVTASVSGIVLDETNNPIANAVVTSGAANTTTNANGIFVFNNISLSKENGSVTVIKAGYFKGVRSFKTSAGKNHAVRLQLMPKTLSGSVNAATGGVINSNGNATINFPANAFVTSTGAAYTGAVKVYSRWIDPTANNLPNIIPGDLRGVSTNGAESILTTYGMVGAELEDASGNVLKIATGKKATITLPIPTSLSASAPATIVLWHFDDATARWKENGTATKTGSTYTAEVDKFSFWNCDVPNTFVILDYTLINAANNTPLVNTNTRIKKVSDGTYGYGITNNTGFVSGGVPKNEALVLEVVSNVCNTIIYSQNIGPFAANTSLGNINVTIPASQYINFSGVALNCSNAPVTNGYVSFYGAGGINAFVNTTATGSFAFSILNCSGASLAYNYQATDYTTSQQSTLLTGNSTSGSINLGNVLACGTAAGANVYVVGTERDASGYDIAKIWKNGVAANLTNGNSNGSANSVFVSGSDVYVVGSESTNTGTAIAKIWKNGIVTNLTNGSNFANANSVFVSANDVYIAGYNNVASLWKNGVATSLSNANDTADAYSVFVSGTDVYVAGYLQNSGGKQIAKLWKNGVASNLSNGTYAAGAYSVFVLGVDVYAAGYEKNASGKDMAKFWKNGVATNLTNGTNDAAAYSIFVSGTDVYVAGYETSASGVSVAKLWKNGVTTNLTNGSNSADAYSVFVSGADVYVAGYETNAAGFDIAKIWKNGVGTNLTTGNNYSYAYSVFVK